MDFAELELTFSQPLLTPSNAPDAPFVLGMRFRRAGSDADQVLPVGAVTFDLNALRTAANTFDALGRPAYGQVLAEQLFPPGSAARAAFHEYLALSAGSPLRIQVTTGPDAAALQTIVWEALRDPESGALLTTGERIWFSRYLYSQDSRPVTAPARSRLRALVAAASPSDLQADPIIVADELERARRALSGFEFQVLPEGAQRVTLDNLTKLLRRPEAGSEPADVLYLVCHGRYAGETSTIFLEDEQGRTAPVVGQALVERLAEFVQLPRLVVLVACESAGPEQSISSGVMAALGPLLAQAGVPAVLAMHGRVSMGTMARFIPALFEELQHDGQIDRAVASARGTVRDAFDAWMPVLFLRSKSGRLWQEEGVEAAAPAAGSAPVAVDLFGATVREDLSAGARPAVIQASGPESVEVGADDVQQASTFAHLTQFVDRVEPYRHFAETVSTPLAQRRERVLAFVGPEGMGKNWLLDRLEFECQRRGLRSARLELEDDALNSPLAILYALALACKGEAAARWLELYRVWRIGESEQSLEETPYAKNPQQAEQVLSEAFLEALGSMATEGPVVLLFDSLDSPALPEPTRRWLIETLVDRARAVGGFGVLPVVSLSDSPDYADKRWARLEVHVYEHGLEAFDAAFIRQYLLRRGLPEALVESRVPECLEQTGGVPLRVAAYARQLLRAARAARPEPTGGAL